MRHIRLTILLAVMISSVQICKAAMAPDGAQLIHLWNIQSVEIMGVETAPDATMAGDMLDLNADDTFNAIFDGVASTGTYGVNDASSLVTLYMTADAAMRLKVIMNDGTHLKVDRVDSEGNHVIVTYIKAD